MFLIFFTLPSMLLACGSREPTMGTVPEVCAGCPVQAEVNQQIVDFAVSQLQGSGGQCSRTDVQVENFQSQVVAGMLYKFDLVLRHENTGGCSKDDGEEERCHVEVYDVPWLQQRELAQTNCSRD